MYEGITCLETSWHVEKHGTLKYSTQRPVSDFSPITHSYGTDCPLSSSVTQDIILQCQCEGKVGTESALCTYTQCVCRKFIWVSVNNWTWLVYELR